MLFNNHSIKFYNISFLFLLIAIPIISLGNQLDSVSVKVMSYNIQTGTQYQSDTPQKIAILLEEWDIDILCTQELHTPHVKLFETALLGYDWIGVGRDNGKDLGETSVIFYRKEKYEYLEESTFWLSETPEIPGSKSWGTSDTRIVTWGKFRIKSNSKVFFVFNTHYDHISSYARSESSKLLRIKMREIAGLNPIIITGDFNCSEDSTPYNLIVENHPDDLSIVNSEKVSITDPFGPSGSYNNFNNDNPTRRIDFIFTNKYMKTLSCGIINEKPNGEFISDHFPLYVNLLFNFPSAPTMPRLIAIPGNNQVNLSWDNTSEDSTYESFLIEGNDFQGYKLYRSRDPEMKDAELIPDSWDIPLLRSPLLISDKIDGIYGFTDYGIIEGFGYYLGDDSGLQHYYNDSDVVNGQEYYYVLTAYDSGISDIGGGFAPNESNFEFLFDDENNLIYQSRNTAVVTPKEPINETIIPTVNTDENNITLGNATINAEIFNPIKVTEKVTYKIIFSVDTLEHLEINEKYRHKNDLLYVNNGFKIFRNDNDSLVYFENITSYPANNILFDKTENFHYLNYSVPVVTEEFNGIQLAIKYASRTAQFSSAKSGWIKGNSEMVVLPSNTESLYFPWKYEIIFTDDNEAYTGVTNKLKGFRSHDDKPIGPAALILNQSFNFYVINKSFVKTDGTYEKLDMVIYDVDMDGSYNRQIDQILVGNYVTIANQILWSGTVFALDFSNISDNLLMPKHGDSYLVDFDRPFMESDEILINVDPEGDIINLVKNIEIPEEFNLKQNYPNPFNPLTTIEFSIAQEGKYSLKVYNIIGQSVATLYNKEFGKGSYSTSFNSTGLSSGVYFYRLDGPVGSISKKMILLK